MIAGFEDRRENGVNRRHSAGATKRLGAVFESGNTVFHRLDGGIQHARIDIPFFLAAEQRRAMLCAAKFKCTCLIYGCDNRTMHVFLRPCMDGLRFERKLVDRFQKTSGMSAPGRRVIR